jgi:hypothetical protein
MKERLEGVDASFDDGNACGWVSKRFPALSETLSRMRCGTSYAFPLSTQNGELMVLIWPEMIELWLQYSISSCQRTIQEYGSFLVLTTRTCSTSFRHVVNPVSRNGRNGQNISPTANSLNYNDMSCIRKNSALGPGWPNGNERDF